MYRVTTTSLAINSLVVFRRMQPVRMAALRRFAGVSRLLPLTWPGKRVPAPASSVLQETVGEEAMEEVSWTAMNSI